MNYTDMIQHYEQRKVDLAKLINRTENPDTRKNLQLELDDAVYLINKYNKLIFEENYERTGYGDER